MSCFVRLVYLFLGPRASSRVVRQPLVVVAALVLSLLPSLAEAASVDVSSEAALAAAITNAAPGDTIVFANDFAATGALPTVAKNLTFAGPGYVTGTLSISGASVGLTASGDNLSLVVTNGATLTRTGSAFYSGGDVATSIQVTGASQFISTAEVRFGATLPTDVTVTDNSQLTVQQFLTIAGGSSSHLRVLNGGLVTTTKGFIGVYSTGVGTVTVNGATSRMQSDNSIIVGFSDGTGTLNVQNGGTAEMNQLEFGKGIVALESSGVLHTHYATVAGAGPVAFDFNGGIFRARSANTNIFQGFAAGDVTILGGGAFIDTNGFDVGIGSILDGTGVLTKQGAGTLTLSTANTYSGGTAIAGGVLAISAANNLGAAGTPVTFTGGTLSTTGTFSLGRPATLGAAGGTTHIASGTLTYSGAIGGTGALTKTGSGTLILSGTNTFTGTTTVDAGTLQIGSGASGTLAGNLVNNSALTFNRSNAFAYSGAISGPGTVTKSGNGVLTLSGASSYSGGTTVTAGTLAIAATGAIGTGDAVVTGGMLRFESNASAGTRAIAVNGGQARFAGTSTAGSATIVTQTLGFAYFLENASAGTAVITNNGTSFTSFEGNATADNATINTTADAFVDVTGMAGTGIAIGAIDGPGNVHLGAKTLTTGGLNTSTTIGGVIDGTGGALVKTGTGLLSLTAANTYTGGTTVSSGTLRVNNSAASGTGTGAVVIASGATLSGAGTIAGAVIAQAGSSTAPGNSIGTLSVGSYEWNAGATLAFELSNTDTTSDRLAIANAFTKAGAGTFAFDFGGTGLLGQTYTLATFASTTFTSAADFTATNLPAGLAATFVLTPTALQVTVTPPPTLAPTVTLAAGGITFTENGSALAIDGALDIADGDSATLASATVRLTTNFSGTEDRLAAPTLQGNIAASYDEPTGVLTLTSAGATATLVQWRDTLRAVTYRNTSDAPSTATRTVSIVVNDGANASVAATRTVAVTAVNDAPALTPAAPTLSALGEDDTNDAGILISSFLGARISDVDTGALSGIAIVAADAGNGQWQVARSPDPTWINLGTVTPASAVLLRSNDRLRFLPDGLNATSAAFTYRAWDQTTGSLVGDATASGGTTAFSAASDTATISVTAVNDAPTLSGGPYAFTAAEAAVPSGAVTVSAILAGVTHTDPDAAALAGLAASAATGSGHWQYSTDGLVWTNFGAVSPAAALLLEGATQVRYAGDGTTAETASFTFRAWDRTAGTGSTNGARSTADTSSAGGTAAFSSGTANATIVVTVNPAPAVVSVSATTPNGAYRAGQDITLTVTFDRAVDVTGSPRLQLNSGANVFANFVSRSGSILTFTYAIAAGETAADLDYVSTAALTLNGGTIRSATFANAILTLAAPGTAGSLGANKSIVVDTAAPAAPSITAISDDTGASATDRITSDNTLVFSGTAEPNSSVAFTRETLGVLGTVTADAGGAWSYNYTATVLAPGDHAFSARATDAAGNDSAASASFIVTVDTGANAPVITAITTDTGSSSTDAITADATLTLFGTAEPNGTVTLNRGGIGALGTATANSSGLWSYNYTGTALADGTYLFSATVVDSAGNTSSASADFAVVIDTAPPAAPAIGSFSSDTGASNSDRITNDSTLTLSGTADPGSVVTLVRVGMGAIGSATADAGGTWSFDYTATPLSEGTHTFTATAGDRAGNTSIVSADLSITIDTTAPLITSPTTASGTYRTAFSYGIATATPAVTFSATGLPAGLSVDAATGTISGAPTLTGAFTVTLGATDLAGNTANATLSLTIAPAVVTASGLVAQSKIVDGTNTATFSLLGATLSGVFPGDTVALAGGTATFADAGIGSGKTVTISGLTLTGASAANYQLASSTFITTANINPRPPTATTISFGNLSQTYDGQPKLVSVSTSPVGVATSVAYNGGSAAPTNAGIYTVTAMVTAAGYTGSGSATLTIARAPQTILFEAPRDVRVGQPTQLRASASSGLPVAFALVSGNATLEGATLVPRDATPVAVRAVQAGNDNYLAAEPVELVLTGIAKREQTIAFAPLADRKVNAPSSTLSATATSGLPVAFALVTGPATLSTDLLTLGGAPGAVTVRASQPGNAEFAAAPDVERTFTVMPLVIGRFVNLSARARAGDAAQTFITGFIVGGGTPKQLLARAIGPGLTAFGVTGALADPILRVSRNGAVVAENANWANDPAVAAAAAKVGAFALAPGSADAALLTTLNAGPYNTLVTGGSSTGVVLTEIYSVDGAAGAADQHLVNFSVRAEAGAGENAVIVGFVINGEKPAKLLVRGIGPGLAPFGLGGVALADPRLEFFRGGELIASNDNAEDGPRNAGGDVGAFALPANSRDAALILTLDPGAYSVVLTGAGATTGVALLEVYELP